MTTFMKKSMGSTASVIADDEGNELWIDDADGRVEIGSVKSVDVAVPVVALDAPRLALVIAELSRRLHGMLAAKLPLKDEEPAPPPARAISEMSREEIREELGQALCDLNVMASDAIKYMNEVESGAVAVSDRTPANRTGELTKALRERAQKAAAPT